MKNMTPFTKNSHGKIRLVMFAAFRAVKIARENSAMVQSIIPREGNLVLSPSKLP
jgi:hypothetical protein